MSGAWIGFIIINAREVSDERSEAPVPCLVADGKGNFQPIWQVYGALPEHRMAFPLYVIIDAGSIVRAGTNDLAKAEKALEQLLAR